MDKYLDPLNWVTRTTWLTSGGRKGVQGKGCMMPRVSRVFPDQAACGRTRQAPSHLLCWFFLSSTEDSEDEEEIVHMGNAIMSFYSALIDLLGRCAPEMHVSIQVFRVQLGGALSESPVDFANAVSSAVWHLLTCLSLSSF